jgi:hypothetical protein
MKKRWLSRVLVLVALAAFAVWLEPTRILWGSLRGEAFYKGRPTSYWAEQIRPWDSYRIFFAMRTRYSSHIRYLYCPKTGNLHQILNRFVELPLPSWPNVLDGDPEAIHVLCELREHPCKVVRQWAEQGIGRVQTKSRGPMITVTWEPGNEETVTRLPGRDVSFK